MTKDFHLTPMAFGISAPLEMARLNIKLFNKTIPRFQSTLMLSPLGDKMGQHQEKVMLFPPKATFPFIMRISLHLFLFPSFWLERSLGK